MTTRTEKLAIEIQNIYISHKKEIDKLKTRGERGGTNAAYINGWLAIGNSTITKAANKTEMPCLNYWSGSAPTPSTAHPYCTHKDMLAAYNKLFQHNGERQ